jgi:mRNA-degrading endonuclease RelE of RelBE toxin-antitoxin system
MPNALYGFAYTPKALATLKTFQPKLRRQIVNKIQALAADPTGPGSKKLQGVTDGDNPVHRARQGKHRILYSVRGAIIVILDIDHRKDVYRMNAAKAKDDNPRMKATDFDRIMGQALRVQPETAKKPKASAKKKTARKKKSAKK